MAGRGEGVKREEQYGVAVGPGALDRGVRISPYSDEDGRKAVAEDAVVVHDEPTRALRIRLDYARQQTICDQNSRERE